MIKLKKTAALCLAAVLACSIAVPAAGAENPAAITAYDAQIPDSASTQSKTMVQAEIKNPVFPGLSDDTGNGIQSAVSLFPSASPKAFSLIKITDYYSNATLGRVYVPSDYTVSSTLFHFGDGFSDCSASAPFMLGITAFDTDNNTTMIYRSRMTYLYPPENDYIEGQIFKGIEMMLYCMNASEYADYLICKINPDVSEFLRESSTVWTDEDDPWLAQQSEYYLAYMDQIEGGPVCDLVYTTSADNTYLFEINGISWRSRIITLSNQLRFNFADIYNNYEMYIPYVYMCTAPADQFESIQQDFELFVSNTSVTDEFIIMDQLRAQALIAALSLGVPLSAELDEEAVELLGYEDGTYDTEQFCDYIKDQNEYTASDGRTFKVPTSFDYVYEGDDGSIYTSSSPEQPPGSTRLYAN